MFEVDGFGARSGDYEARGGVLSEDGGDGCDEEVGAFVVEKAGYYDDGDEIIGSERRAGTDRVLWAGR